MMKISLHLFIGEKKNYLNQSKAQLLATLLEKNQK